MIKISVNIVIIIIIREMYSLLVGYQMCKSTLYIFGIEYATKKLCVINRDKNN